MRKHSFLQRLWLFATVASASVSLFAANDTTPYMSADVRRNGGNAEAVYAVSPYDLTQLGKPTMTIACISDIHTQYVNATEFELRESFRKAVEAIHADEDIDLMIIGGDNNNSSNYNITESTWEYAVGKLKTTAQEAFQDGRTYKPVFVVDGNHDYESAGTSSSGTRSYNSGEYYNHLMESTIGPLDASECYYETASNGSKGNMTLLAAFHYVINGFDFIGLNTGKYLFQNSGDYNYSIGSVNWVASKLDEIDPDGTKTVFLAAHIPFGDSNSISASSKGMGSKDGSADALKKALAKHPNTIMLYGHDHGGNAAYLQSKTSQRVTRYATDGTKLSGATDATHVDGITLANYATQRRDGGSMTTVGAPNGGPGGAPAPDGGAGPAGPGNQNVQLTLPEGSFYLRSVGNGKYASHSTSSSYDENNLVLTSDPSLLFTLKAHATKGAVAVYATENGKYLYAGNDNTFSISTTSNPSYLFKQDGNNWKAVTSPVLGESYVIVVKGKSNNSYYALVNTETSSNSSYPRLGYTEIKADKNMNSMSFKTSNINTNTVLWTFEAPSNGGDDPDNPDDPGDPDDPDDPDNPDNPDDPDDPDEPDDPYTPAYDENDHFFSAFMGSMRYYSNYFQTDKDNYTNERVLIQGLMIYIYPDRIILQNKNYGQYKTVNGITVQETLVPYTTFRNTTNEPVERKVQSVTLSQSSLFFDLLDAQPATLKATVLPMNATNATLTWASSDESVATVADGVVTPKGVGTCTVSATTTDGTEISATCAVTVTKTILTTGLSLDETSLSFDLAEPTTATLTATVLPTNATNAAVTWKSSDTSIATVADGVVTPKGVGTCTVTATTTDGTNLSAACAVNVKKTIKVNLTDGTAYSGTETVVCDELTYTRTFATTDWQPFFVPFKMSSNEWKDDFDIAYILDMRNYDDDFDGACDRLVIEYVTIKSGTLKPNYPYVILPKTTGEYVFRPTDQTLYPAKESSVTTSTSTATFTFTGTYASRSLAFLQQNDAYTLVGGQFTKATEAIGANAIYMTIATHDMPYEAEVTYPNSVELRGAGYDENGDVTLIEGLQMDDTEEWWCVDGRRVNAEGASQLAPGIYVKNGKKVIIR